MNDKIFISMASYRDPELIPTINDCIKRADHPENLVFCIAWQHDSNDAWDNLDDFKNDKRFIIIDIPHEKSKGACWARSLIQKKYKKEQYYLQLDSHHRFANGWDTRCKSMLNKLKEHGYEKPILTSYIPSYNPKNDPRERVKEVWQLNFDRFTPEGVIFMLPALMEDWEEKKEPVPTRFFSAHFAFTLGKFVKEVPYDPNLYFHGEEITLAVRAYTHGYDLFVPHQIVAWHEYTRQGRVRHWDENKKWEEWNKSSLKLCKGILGVDGEYFERYAYKYGLGKERTLEDYERYAGIRFATRAIQTYTLNNFDAPNPTYSTPEFYDKTFIQRFRHCIDVWKPDIDKDWDAWAVIFEDAENNPMFRLDVEGQELEDIKQQPGEFYNIWREFVTDKLPHHAVVWPHNRDGEWGRKLDIEIPTI